MIEKKGWLKEAEARTTGLFIKGKKVKGVSMTQEQVDAWNGVEAAPAPAPVVEEVAVVVEEVAEEPEPETVVEEAPAPKTFFKKKKKK